MKNIFSLMNQWKCNSLIQSVKILLIQSLRVTTQQVPLPLLPPFHLSRIILFTFKIVVRLFPHTSSLFQLPRCRTDSGFLVSVRNCWVYTYIQVYTSSFREITGSESFSLCYVRKLSHISIRWIWLLLT